VTPSTRRRRFSLSAVLCCLLLARAGVADEAEAEGLFKEGLEAMRAGNYDAACPKIRESHRLDPLPGVLFTLAECEAAAGRSATAIQLYQEFVNSLTSLPSDRRDQFDERRRMALDKVTALSALAPEITVDVANGAPGDLVVKRNDMVIEASAYGVGKKVDQGDYVVSAELKGKQVWERRFKLQERDRARIEVPWPIPKSGSEEPEPPVKITPAPAPEEPEKKPLSKTWMYVSGGVGAAGLATGIVAGLIAMGKKGDIEDNCPNRQCNAVGRDAVDSGQSAATISSIGFAVGIAGAGATVALFFLTKDPPRDEGARAPAWRGLSPNVAVSDRGGAIGLRGSF
jgi:hypothetical protein